MRFSPTEEQIEKIIEAEEKLDKETEQEDSEEQKNEDSLPEPEHIEHE